MFYFPSEGAPAALRETQSPCADNSMADDDDELVDNTAKANRADMNSLGAVSYTHLTLPTKRIV